MSRPGDKLHRVDRSAPERLDGTELRELDSANSAIDEAPSVNIEVPCRSQELVLSNAVMPSVTVVQFEGFYHADQFQPALVTLRIIQTTGNPAYVGTGTATVAAGNANLFSNAGCTIPLVQPLSANALINGVPVYVKGGAAGEVTVRLTLTAPNDPRIQCVMQAEGTVTVIPVNVITPVITGDELVLVHDGFPVLWATTLSELQVSFQQSHPGRPCPDLVIRLTYGNQIACFEDALQNVAFNSNSTVAAARTLHVRGANQGDCTVQVAAEGTPGPAWRFAAPVDKTLRVERLTLDAHEFRDGLVVGGGGANLAAGGPPKTRELHQRNGGVFTFARFIMRRPSDAFWAKASRITLTAHGGVAMFSDQAATAALANLVQGNFAGGDVVFWVKTTAVATALTPEPGHGIGWNWPAWAAHAPEKETVQCRVSCGATITGSNKELRLGDLVVTDTFSHDRTLDRNVRNECGNRVIAPGLADLQRQSAVARTQAHKYYDNRSGFWVNHYYRANNTSPFNAFIAYIGNAHNPGQRPNRGANFVENHLWDQYAIALDPLMKNRIRNYITNVLAAGASQANDFGFQRLYGLPGTHAECLAANEMMLAGIAPANITVATYMLQAQNGRQGKRFIACPNCQGVLNPTFRVITG